MWWCGGGGGGARGWREQAWEQPRARLSLHASHAPTPLLPHSPAPQAGPRQRLYLLVGSHPHKRSNATALVGIFSVLYLGHTPERAYAPLRALEPFVGFRDASCGVPTYQLPVQQAIAGVWRAKEVGFINWHRGEVLDVDEYEHYEQVGGWRGVGGPRNARWRPAANSCTPHHRLYPCPGGER